MKIAATHSRGTSLHCASRRYEFSAQVGYGGMRPIYTRGLAYLQLGDGEKAAGEYQRLLDHRGNEPFSGRYYLAKLNLARAYVLQGDTAKARKTYHDFLADWKDADADLPLLVAAKQEYAKLQ